MFRVPPSASFVDYGLLDNLTREALKKIAEEVRDDVRLLTPYHKGKLRRSIRASATGNWQKGFTAKVFAYSENPAKVRALENGWPIGTTPNIGALQRWARSKGMGSKASMPAWAKAQDMAPHEYVGFIIAMAMRARGFKNRPFGWRMFHGAERRLRLNKVRHQAFLDNAISGAFA